MVSGVEEQFYIAWPVLIVLTFSRRISIVLLAVALLIISFAWNVTTAGTPASFYLPLTRAWELMIGGTIATVASPNNDLNVPRTLDRIRAFLITKVPGSFIPIWSYCNLRTLIGLVFIIAAVVLLDKDRHFPGWWALLPTLGTAFIISADGAWFNRRILSAPAVVLIGLISYPLYLWHWPLLSFARIIAPEPSKLTRIGVVFSAVLLALATYQWIERPIRSGPLRLIKTAGLCFVMTAIAGAGFAAFQWQGFPTRIPPVIRSIESVKLNADFEQSVWRLHTCLLERDDLKSQFTPDCIEPDHRPLLFLWGDSFAAALYPGLKQLQRTLKFGLAQYTTAGCPPVLSLAVPARPHCMENNDYVFAVVRDTRPDIVLLYSTWESGYGDFIPNLMDLIAKLRLLKIPRIIVMGPPPAWTGGLPQAVYAYYQLNPLDRMIPTRSSFRVTGYLYQQQFRNRVRSLGVEYISAWDALCIGEECLTRVGDSVADLMAFDEAHLTVPGAIYLAKAIAPCLFPAPAKSLVFETSDRADLSIICHRPGD